MRIKIIIRMISLAFVISLSAACSNNEASSKKVSNRVGDLKTAAEVNVQLAVGYIQRKQYEVAKQKLDKAIEQNEENLDAYKMLAYLMSILGKNEEAEDYYEEALDIKPDDPEIHNSYGAFLCNQGRLDEAIASFKTAYENPYYQTSYLAYSNAGSCLLKQKKYTEAEAHLRKALQDQPKLGGALLSMAEVGVSSGKYLMARAYIQRYHIDNAETAESLWIQAQAEKALGAEKYYLEAARRILKDFPDSTEAGLIEESVRNDRSR